MASDWNRMGLGSTTDDNKRPSDAPKNAGEAALSGGRSSFLFGDKNIDPEILVPNNLGFLYKIDELEITRSDDRPERIVRQGGKGIGTDIATYWYPPNRKGGFNRTPGRLFRWRRETTTLMPNSENLSFKRYSATSVCFQARQDNFLAARVDCTDNHVREQIPGWCQVMFHHRNSLSEVDFAAGSDGLAAPAKGLSWMPQVLPEVYDYNTKGPRVPKPYPKSAGLCGRLGILLGMAAFSTNVEQAETVVARCFRFGRWIPHSGEAGIGRYRDRGVVVTIYLDPTAVGIREKHLKALEDGVYGPTFAGY